jgi:hypothetical protein
MGLVLALAGQWPDAESDTPRGLSSVFRWDGHRDSQTFGQVLAGS